MCRQFFFFPRFEYLKHDAPCEWKFHAQFSRLFESGMPSNGLCALLLLSPSLFVCANSKFIYTFPLTNFPHMSFLRSLHFAYFLPYFCCTLLVHFYLFMMVLLRRLFWLIIKSVIELCDMNNLLLFSRAGIFSRSRLHSLLHRVHFCSFLTLPTKKKRPE